MIDAGANPIDLKRGIEKAVECVVKSIASQAKKISANDPQIRHIATISANDEDLGNIIADARGKIGDHGHVWLQKSLDEKTWIDVVDGIHFDQGFLNPYFINNQLTASVEFKDAYVLLYDKKISDLREIESILNIAITDQKPLLIIAEDVDREALSVMVINKLKNNSQFAAVKTPGAGVNQKEFLEDLAAVTGGKLISEEKGNKLSHVTREHLGKCNEIVVTKSTTIIRGGKGNKRAIEERKHQALAMSTETKFEVEKERQRLRIARLSNSIAIMYVGAVSDVEMEEKRMRAEDALLATRAAIVEGIVPGGGVTYLQALNDLVAIETKNAWEQSGVVIVRNALESPIRQILLNAGLDSDTIISKIRLMPTSFNIDYGFNAKTEEYGSMFEMGIIDPAKVVRCALENAASVASMFLMCECAIVNAE